MTNDCNCCFVIYNTISCILPIEVNHIQHIEGFNQVHTVSKQLLYCVFDSGAECGNPNDRESIENTCTKMQLFPLCSNRFQAEKCRTMSPNEIITWGKDFFEDGQNAITQVGLLPGHWRLKDFQLLWKVPQDLSMTAKEWALDIFF